MLSNSCKIEGLLVVTERPHSIGDFERAFAEVKAYCETLKWYLENEHQWGHRLLPGATAMLLDNHYNWRDWVRNELYGR
jgi:hypothetical protein